jgi:hypothetical protein
VAQTLSATYGVPEEEITSNASGLSINYVISQITNQSAINGVTMGSDVWSANFYNSSDFTAVDSATGLVKPAGLTTFDGYTPQDTYQWNCYNAAQEIQSRIRLFIRKWDTDPIVQGGTPNSSGYSGTYPTDPLDDHYDWKDMAGLMSGAEYPGADL